MLPEKDEATQVHALVYAMGDEGDDVLSSFPLSEDDCKKYATVLEKSDGYFVKRRNVIFERAKFNVRKQEEGEPIEEFILDLYCLAEHSGYGTMHDEMVRDRIIVGICNSTLSVTFNGLFGTLRQNPQLDNDWVNWMMGLKAMRKMRGERVSPWKTPLLILNLSVDQSVVFT